MLRIRERLVACALLVLLSVSGSLLHASEARDQLNDLRANVDAIERDVSQLEQNLLFPPLTRVKVYLSLENDADYTPRSVSLRIDGREQSFHVYSPEEVTALRLGGIQTLWEGNVALGERRLSASFEGVDRTGDEVKGEAALTFEKTLKGRALELQVVGKPETAFKIKDWGEN